MMPTLLYDTVSTALPSGVAGVGFGEPVGNAKAVAEGFQGLREIALGHQHVADPIDADRTGRAAIRCCRGRLLASRSKMTWLSRKVFRASGRLPWATSTSPTQSYDTDRSRCHPALPGSALASRSKMTWLSRKVFRASGRLPWATSTTPTLLYDTDRSRCHRAFAGLALASRSAMARPSRKRFQSLRVIALGHQHVADLDVGHDKLALPSGVARVGLGQSVGNSKAVAEGFQGLREIALGHQYGANSVIIYNRIFSLNLYVVALGASHPLDFGEASPDRPPVPPRNPRAVPECRRERSCAQ